VRRDETLAGLIYDRRAAERDRRHLTEATAFVPRTCLLSPGGRLPPGAPPPRGRHCYDVTLPHIYL